MSNLALFIAAHQTARDRASAFCQSAPEGTVIKFETPVKSREQEEKYHALINEIADNPPPEALAMLGGRKLNRESWKRLLIDAFKKETTELNPGNYPELQAEWAKFGSAYLLPALNHDGFVMVGEQSRKFGKKLAGAFITWLQAFQDGVA